MSLPVSPELCSNILFLLSGNLVLAHNLYTYILTHLYNLHTYTTYTPIHTPIQSTYLHSLHTYTPTDTYTTYIPIHLHILHTYTTYTPTHL